jgi:three-Cys-motif partner protein
MSDGVLLHMEEHTRAKHQILKAYIDAWLPIMILRNARIVYLDGFAGSGEYDDGSIGSPIISLECAANHMLKSKFDQEAIFYFIEKDGPRHEHLVGFIANRFKGKPNGGYENLPSKFTIVPEHGEFNTVMEGILEGLEDKKETLAPTFAFVDPFGYSDIKLNILARILKFQKCELFITYMVGFIDRFATEILHQPSIKTALVVSDQEIQRISSISNSAQREIEWLNLLTSGLLAELRRVDPSIPAPYHLYFKVKNRTNNTLYYLVYYTKSISGVKVMKEAMWKVGSEGQYLFSDYDFLPGQTSLVDYSQEKPWQREAAEYLYNYYKGKSVPVAQLENQVILHTPWIWRKKILQVLEDEKKIEVLGNRPRAHTYPDDSSIRFL